MCVLGLRTTGEEYLSALTNQGFKVGRVARIPLLQISSGTETNVELARISAVNLDVTADTPLSEISRRGLELGLKLCRQEIAPALREQYPDQPPDEVLWIVTKPISARRELGYFSLGHDSRGRWLCLGCGGPDCWWGRLRRVALNPERQEKLVSLYFCE